MNKKYSIKNWAQFQHFKDRNPPWVKLYRTLLEDMEWNNLKPESAKILVMLWLLASESNTKDGSLPTVEKMAFRLRVKKECMLLHLKELSHWVLCDDIEAISTRYQSDAPETETETKKEVEKEVDVSPSGETENAKPKSFKQWTIEDLTKSVEENNTDKLLTEQEATDFIGYWTQKTATGRLLLATEKTFDTRRRMQTALRVVYSKQRGQVGPSNNTSFANQKPASFFKSKERIDYGF